MQAGCWRLQKVFGWPGGFAKKTRMASLRTRLAGWQTRLAAQLAQRSPSENAFLFLLPVVGLVTGLASVGIAHVIAFLQNQFWGSGN